MLVSDPGPNAVALLTQTLMGCLPGGPGPWPVLVEGVALLAVRPHRVVLADAGQHPALVLDTFAGVAVALTPEDRETGDGRLRGSVGVCVCVLLGVVCVCL